MIFNPQSHQTNEPSFGAMLQQRRANPIKWLDKICHTFDLIAFCEQFACLLHSGISIRDALLIQLNAIKSQRQKENLKQLLQQVENGRSLAASMTSLTQYFDPFFCQLIACGEQSGQLIEILKEIAKNKRKMLVLKNKIRKKTLYPLFLIFISCGILLFFLLYLLPSFEQLFIEFHVSTPKLCQCLFFISHLLQQHLLLFCLFFIKLLFIVIFLLYRFCSFNLLYKLPGLGMLLHLWLIGYALFILSMLLKAGLPLSQSILEISRLSPISTLNQQWHSVALKLGQGASLTFALKKTDLLPHDALQMIEVGEQSGYLDPMIETVAAIMQSKVLGYIEQLTTWIEPLFIIGIGGVISLLITMLYGPFIQLGLSF